MSKRRQLTVEKDLKAILYYCVREDFNAQRDPKFIDQNYDATIRLAIDAWQSEKPFPKVPITQIELIGLDNCARRRGIKLKLKKKV